MKKYTIPLLLIIAGAAHLAAMEESIQVELADDKVSTISPEEFDAFLEIIEPGFKEELEARGAPYSFGLAGQAGFDFFIKNVDSFKNNDTKAINTALEELYTSKDSATFASMLEVAHYLNIKPALESAFLFIDKNIFAMIKNNPAFLEAILKIQKKYKKDAKFFTIDIQDDRKKTALMRAAYYNRTKIVPLLIAVGADINKQAPDGDGMAALLFAAYGKNPEIVEILLKAGANPIIRAKHSGSALELARGDEKEKIQELILNAAIKHIKDNVQEYKSDDPTVLYKKFNDLNKNYTEFVAFFHAAAEAGDKENIEEIINAALKSISEFTTETIGKTITQEAFEEKKSLYKFFTNFFPMLKEFLEEHEITIKDNRYMGTILLKIAEDENTQEFKNAGYNEVKLVDLLLDAGANIHTYDTKGNTLLARAARKGNKEMVKLLLEKGADPNKRGNISALDRDQSWLAEEGPQKAYKSPLDLTEDKEIRKMLIDAGAKEE